MSLLLRGGTVVIGLDPAAVVAGDVLIRDGRVAAVAPGPAPTRAPDPAPSVSDDQPMEVLDCRGALVAPGNVCAHTHAYAALARGMPGRGPAPRSFLEILQRVWWRLDRALDAPSIAVSALVAGREALRAGTTTLIDHHASPNAIDGSLDLLADAFEALGLRSVLAYEVTDRDGPERASAGLRENERFLARVSTGSRPLTRGLLGAHASFTLSEETLERCVTTAGLAGVGLHLHVAEDGIDQADALGRYGERVLARLARAGALDSRAVLAHAVHLDRAEAELARDRGVTIAHNPRSNMHNGVGRAPLAWLGDRVALGTDGIGGDLFEEARAAYLRRREEELGCGPAWAVARVAQGSRLAAALFEEPALGRIEVGAPADLVVLEASTATPLDAGNLAAHWIYGIGAEAVRDVLDGGRIVVRDRRLTTLDEAELMTRARREAGRLWARLEEIGPHPFSPEHRLVGVAAGSSGAA